MTDRPYKDDWIAVLRKRADADWSDPTRLNLLYVELTYRRRRAPLLLRERIEKHLASMGKGKYFDWPTTEAPGGTSRLSDGVFQVQEGLLSFVGYRVGRNCASAQKRQALLEAVYEREVPPVSSREYMLQWGKPKTAKRLKKLANALAAFTRQAKRNNPETLASAIADWEVDLAYLKRKFYAGVYSFTWPETRARIRKVLAVGQALKAYFRR